MECHVCGTVVRPEHKFCAECGARLRHQGPGDLTAPHRLDLVPPQPSDDATDRSETAAPSNHPMFDPVTGKLMAVPPPPPGPPPEDVDATNVLPALGEPEDSLTSGGFGPPTGSPQGPGQWGSGPREPARPAGPARPVPTRPPYGDYTPAHGQPYAGYNAPTSRVPATYTPWEAPVGYAEEYTYEAPRAFRVKPMLFLAVLAVAAAVTSMVARVIRIDAAPGPLEGDWKLNDFGTNLTVTTILISLTMLFGAVSWCAGFRWGAGTAGGAGAGLAGLAALVLGEVEVPIAQASDATREIGYWALAAAGGLGLVVLLASLRRAGDDRRPGLDPWVAALGAMATIAAVIGPLIPVGNGRLDENWTSPPGVDLPTLFFAGRVAQLGLLMLCGVFGFLLVRRYGLGLAIGGTIGVGWMLLTAATEQTDNPIGPAIANPGDFRIMLPDADGKPHIVTVVGVGLMLFFGLVATAMALIDTD